MSFVLAPEETPGEALQRVIEEQVAKLAAECVGAFEDTAAFAHKARVRAKRVRAALRLARPLMGAKTFKAENRWWRDAARMLSELRDAGARVEALETLRPFLEKKIGAEAMRKLAERFERSRKAVDASMPVTTFIALIEGRRQQPAPKLELGNRTSLQEALGETYRFARRTMKEALESGDPLLLHEWRKQTKYHALQARLMRQVFPLTVAGRVATARAVAELLGEVQDIEVVLEDVRRWSAAPRGLRTLLNERRKELVGQAAAAGHALFAEKPKAWAKSLNALQGVQP